MKNKNEIIHKAIDYFGGRQELAKKLGVSYRSVIDWAGGRSNIGALNALKIEKLTNCEIKREDILPNYPWESLG